MTIKLSARVRSIVPSATLAVTSRAKDLAAKGVDVVSFGAGEPDFDTPAFIVEAMAQAARKGHTRYTQVAGIPKLREAVAKQFSARYEVPFSASETLVSVGGKQALFNLFLALVDPGDEVILPAPYWVSYPEQVMLAGGTTRFVQTDPGRGFALDPARVEAAITARTVGIVLNSPNNPTGAVLDQATLHALGDLAEARGLWVVSDDIYSELRYQPGPFPSILRGRPELKERVFVVHGTAKTYGMTGWRIGFLGAPAAIVEQVATLQGQSTSNPTSFAQYGALAAVESDHAFLVDWLEAYDARRRRITALLNDIEGVRCQLPGGAFYAFPDIRGILGRRFQGEAVTTDLRFAELCLEHAHVAVVPGAPFGAPGFMRLSYACSMHDIERGVGRIADFCRQLEG
jgi:aspartate aminotransferase